MLNGKSTIPVKIRDLIPYPESQISDNRLADNINAEKFTDILLGIGDLRIISSDVALEELGTIEAIDDLELKGMAMAGIGAMQTYIGNYFKAFGAFHRAFELVTNPEALAFVFSEISNLLRQLGYKTKAVTIIDEAIDNCKNQRLIWQLKWQKAFCYKYTDPELALEMLQGVADYYDANNDLLQFARIKKHIGNIYSHLQNYEKGDSCYNEAMEIAVQIDALHLQYDILNDRGWMLYLQGKYDKAKSLFLGLIKKDLHPYVMALALQNLGVLEYSRKNYREAIRYHSESLQLTTRYEMRNMLYEDYYKLGLCHERLGEFGLAEFFYYTGYKEFHVEYNLGLPLSSDQKTLLDRYIEFLRINQKIPHLDLKDETFGFALDRPLKEIRDIFYVSLLSLHIERTKNAPQLCKKLQVDTRTYFFYQKKLGLKRGVVRKGVSKNPYFTKYLESLAPLTWREANRKFETDLYSYLLEKYQYNKTKLAEALGVSYQQVLQKTK